MREPLLISACLLGVNCKYNGGNNYCPAVEKLREKYDLIPICPESAGGLAAPREPSERVGERVLARDGTDVTAAFQKGAEAALETALRCGAKKALLKARSPSCGVGEIYDGTFSGRLVAGDGVAAALLRAHGVTVCTALDLVRET